MAIPLKYNVRSLLVRRVSTAMTGGGIALVVCVFVIVMALVAGLNSAISDTGDPHRQTGLHIVRAKFLSPEMVLTLGAGVTPAEEA